MADNGVKSIDLANASLLDEVIGNRSGSTVAATMETLSQQLLGDGPLADAMVTLDERLSLNGPTYWRNTLSGLNTITGTTNDHGFVVNDSANNGVYRWTGSWGKVADLPGALGYRNLDDTRDDLKPVSGPQAAAISLKADANALAAVVATGSYSEYFKSLDLTTIVATNRADGVPTSSYTASKVSAGLQVALSLGSRLCTFRTPNVTGPKKTRYKYRGEHVAGSTAGAGIGFSDGTNYTSFLVTPYNGRLSFTNSKGGGGILSSALPVVATTWTVDLDVVVDAEAQTATLFVSINGGAPYAFDVGNIAIGNVELGQINSSTVIHRMEVDALGEYQSGAIDVAVKSALGQTERNTLAAAAGYLGTIERRPPAGWTLPIPNGYKFYQNASKFFSGIGLSPILSATDPEVNVLHVSLATGSDTNLGTATAPLKSLRAAQTRAGGKTIIKAMGGLYGDPYSFAGIAGGTKLQVVSWDGNPVISSRHDSSLTWTLDTDGTYFATFTNSVVNVFDAAVLTSDGDYSRLVQAISLAACKATPGTYYISGQTIYVHRIGDAAPSASLRVYKKESSNTADNYGLRVTTDGLVGYFENIHFEGGVEPFSSRAASITHRITCYFKTCTFKYAGGANGLNYASAGLIVLQDCIAAWNSQDGLNYKSSPFGGIGNLAIEIDCITRWNGYDAEGTNNGTSQHGGDIIRVNPISHDNQNRNIHDIGANGQPARSWIMGGLARDSQTISSNFAIGAANNNTDASKMWLDGCASSGSSFDIETGGTAAIAYTSNFTGDAVNKGSGTILAYVA